MIRQIIHLNSSKDVWCSWQSLSFECGVRRDRVASFPRAQFDRVANFLCIKVVYLMTSYWIFFISFLLGRQAGKGWTVFSYLSTKLSFTFSRFWRAYKDDEREQEKGDIAFAECIWLVVWYQFPIVPELIIYKKTTSAIVTKPRTKSFILAGLEVGTLEQYYRIGVWINNHLWDKPSLGHVDNLVPNLLSCFFVFPVALRSLVLFWKGF